MSRIVELVFNTWKKNNVVIFKEDEKKVFQRAVKAIEDDFFREAELEKDVHRMMDDLEKQGSQFQRSKMFHMLKQKLATERKIPL